LRYLLEKDYKKRIDIDDFIITEWLELYEEEEEEQVQEVVQEK